jgi:Tol biopolymer transport system component
VDSRLRTFLAIAAGLVVFAVSVPAYAAFPGKNGKIAFIRANPGTPTLRLFTMEPDGSAVTQFPLGNLPRANFPAWSPDGKRIAFTSVVEGTTTDIFVENADGSGQVRITNDPNNDAYPNWSPDGSTIVFARPDSAGNFQLHTTNADGSGGDTKLTSSPIPSWFPAWSPDGSKIAFMREVLFENNIRQVIFVMNPDGSGQTQLTGPGFYSDAAPDWSPDGKKIVFETNRHESGSRIDVYVMNADGSAQTRLTADAPNSAPPAWSPDGTKIVYSGGFDPRTHRAEDIYVMNADGTGKTNLTNAQPEEINAFPDWQPLPGPRRSDYKNAAEFCQAERDFLGEEAFANRYGTNGNAANAYGKWLTVTNTRDSGRVCAARAKRPDEIVPKESAIAVTIGAQRQARTVNGAGSRWT